MTKHHGTSEDPIVDSDMSYGEAVLRNLPNDCPEEIVSSQVVVPVLYYSFDEKVHRGQVVLDNSLTKDVKEVFELILEIKFPIESVIPISHKRFLRDGKWDDELSMQANNTSAFNYRHVPETTTFSNHAYGRAIDINPKLNPYFTKNAVYPEGATYDTKKPGVITPNHPIVKRFKELGWEWGGDWDRVKDYQHFEKPKQQR